MNEIFFPPEFFLSKFVIYRKAPDFCMLNVYPDTLLKIFQIYGLSGGVFKYRIISSANRDNLTFSSY